MIAWMMSAGTAFARAASQPRLSGVRDFGIGADTSRHHRTDQAESLALCRRFALRSAAMKRLSRGAAPLRKSAGTRRNYQRTPALGPPGTGTTLSSPGILSPGTGTALCQLGCSVISSLGEAQAEMRKTTAKNETIGTATRLIMGTNLIRGKFDARSALQ